MSRKASAIGNWKLNGEMADLSILHGGPLNEGDAAAMFSPVGGRLVGGAFLTAKKFIPIPKALEATS